MSRLNRQMISYTEDYANRLAWTLDDNSLRAWFAEQGVIIRVEELMRKHYNDYQANAFHDIVRRPADLSGRQRAVLTRGMVCALMEPLLAATQKMGQDEPLKDTNFISDLVDEVNNGSPHEQILRDTRLKQGIEVSPDGRYYEVDLADAMDHLGQDI